MRRSVLVRLVAVSITVTLGAIVATAWLAALTVATDLSPERSRSHSSDDRIYRELSDYAATHTSWKDAQPLLSRLARETGTQIALEFMGSNLVSSDSVDLGRIPAEPLAVVDPLRMDPSSPEVLASGISRKVAGAYVLAPEEIELLALRAAQVSACVAAAGGTVTVRSDANGRSFAEGSSATLLAACGSDELDAVVTETEYVERHELQRLTNDCLQERGLTPVILTRDRGQPTGFGWQASTAPEPSAAAEIDECLVSSRKYEVSGWVAPPAKLYVFEPPAEQPPPFALSRRNVLRILAVSAAVLLGSVVVTVLAGVRLTRPVRALTSAAELMTKGAAGVRVPVVGSDEIAQLAHSFNTMSAERDRIQSQRTALMSDIAHELRTPLTNIRGWVEARQDGLAEDETAFTDSVLEESVQLQRIVDDLQELAMADAGTLRLRREPVDIARLLRSVAAAHSPVARAQGIELAVSAERAIVNADPGRVRQVVDNLVVNALHHTSNGGRVTVTCRSDSGWVVIEVRDSGSGIPESDLPRVFDRFWRADKSRSRETGSSGLGLTIVRNLTQAHGGSVTVSSEVGVGTEFTVRLPVGDL